MLGGARLARRRALSRFGVLLTATLTALVAAVLLVSATILAPDVAEDALDRALTDGADDATVSVSTGLDEQWPQLDADVRAAADDAGVIKSVTASISSTAFTLPGAADDIRLAVGFIEGADERAELTQGRWPRDDAPTIETAVHATALDHLGIALGDVVEIQPMAGSQNTIEVTVVGAYEPVAASDPAWRDNGAGVRPSSGDDFTVAGPFLTGRSDVLTRITPTTASAQWSLPLDRDDITLGNTSQVTTTVQEMAAAVSELRAGDAGQQMSVDESATTNLLERAGDAASSTRALLLVVVAMLTVLGVWALAFTARLVAAGRAPATALMRARGARERQLLGWSVVGAAPGAVLVAAVTPPLADVALGPEALTPWTWAVSAGVGALWLVLMVAADVRSGRSVTGMAAEGARPRRAAAQRAGLDLLLLALGALGLQQLRQPPEEAPDVVLVGAPALVVLAGAVVLIRALPWAARAAAALSTHRTGIAATLGTQETARRTTRHVAAAVLVVLAITISVFVATTKATWDTFRADTVDLAEPADVRLTLSSTAEQPVDGTGPAVNELPGVESAMPVVRAQVRDGDTTIDLVAIDPERAPTIMRWDGDLAGIDGNGVSAIVSSQFADLYALTPGDDLELDLAAGSQTTVHVAGLAETVPGTDEPVAILTDTDAIAGQLGGTERHEWWLSTSDDGRAAARAALDVPAVATATTHADALDEARDDPASAGVGTGLAAGLAFAAVFVVIGVVVHTVTSFRSRSGEYALLRAIGLSRRGVAGSVAVEHGILLGFSTAAGLGLGLLVSWLTVPHAVGGLAGLPETPPLRIDVPWLQLAVLTGAVIVLTVVLVAIQTALTRRLDVAGVLREGA